MRTASNIDEIYWTALELPPGDSRTAYLNRVCQGKPELRARVERYLRAEPTLGDFLESPSLCLDFTVSAEAVVTSPPDLIGRYQLREQIGEGGMGLVFVAEQTEPVRRQVALKVCKPGMDTREVMTRFEAERQALALMDHPNIAKVFDAGTTDSGRPYFVMELVRGIPITDYCERAKLGTRDRLKLFITVCKAVQHAHLKGIIHRDIKPSNVMVTSHDGVPVPKVIDFGVAKALNQRLTDETVYTQYRQLIGTPLYMSPEQAERSGLDIDIRTDVYSLGVLLYELLTGTTPFDRKTLTDKGFDEFRRQLREEDPVRPSARVSTLDAAIQSTIALEHGLDPRQMSHSLKGELDWIVMKALEKDRTCRYESANAFAADIENYLADVPVNACPPSIGYQLKKQFRRHKTALVTTALVTLSLIVGAIVSLLMAIDATKARKIAYERLANEELAIGQAEAALKDKAAAFEKVATFAKSLYPNSITNAKELLDQEQHLLADRELALFDETESITDYRGFEWYYLRHQGESRVRYLHGHTQPVFCVSFSTDGQTVATASADGTLRLWATSTGRLLKVLDGHSSDVNCVAYSPLGDSFATASDDRTVRIWDSETGECVATLIGHNDMVSAVAYCQEGRAIASASCDGDLKIWDVKTKDELASVQAHQGRIHCLAVSSDGSQLATCGGNDELKVWDSRSLETVMSYSKSDEGHHFLQSVVLQPGSTRVLGAWRSGHIKAWNTVTGELENETYTGRYTVQLAISPDGRNIAVASHRRSGITIWSADDFQWRAFYPLGHESHECWCVSFSPNGRMLAAHVGHDGLHDVLLFHNDHLPQLAFLDEPITSMTPTTDGRSVLVAGDDGTLRLIDPEDGNEVAREVTEMESVLSVAFSPTEEILITGGDHGIVVVRDAVSLNPVVQLSELAGRVTDVAFSIDGSRVAACDQKQVCIWDATTWQVVDKWSEQDIKCLAFDIEGGLLLGGRHLRYRARNHAMEILQGIESEVSVTAIDMTPSGNLAAVGLHRRQPGLVSFQGEEREITKEVTWLSAQGGGHILAVAISRDGKSLATIDESGDVGFWNVATGSRMLTINTAKFIRVTDNYQRAFLAFTPEDSALIVGLVPSTPFVSPNAKSVLVVLSTEMKQEQVPSPGE